MSLPKILSPRALWYRLRTLLRKSRMEDGLTEELHFHLENETEKNVAAGMNPEEARYAALRTFGGVELEHC